MYTIDIRLQQVETYSPVYLHKLSLVHVKPFSAFYKYLRYYPVTRSTQTKIFRRIQIFCFRKQLFVMAIMMS